MNGVTKASFASAALDWSTFTTVASGVKVGHATINEFRAKEISVRQGLQYYMSSMLQIAMVVEAVSVSLFAAAEYGIAVSNPVYMTCMFSAYVLPPVVGYLAAKKSLPWYIHRPIFILHEQIGTLSVLATTVSSVALYVLGQQIFAATTLTFLTIGFLDRNHLLPLSVRQLIHNSNFVVSNSARLFVGGWLDMAVAGVELAGAALDLVARYRLQNYEVKEKKPRKVDLSREQLAQIPSFNSRLDPVSVIRSSAISISIPKAPNVDIRKLNKMAKQIDWKKPSTAQALRDKLRGDKRWQAYSQKGGSLEKYLKENLASFVSAIRNRDILEGEPADYKLIETYVQHITRMTEEMLDPKSKKYDPIAAEDILMRLGIEGGRYCGPGKFEVAEDIFRRLYYRDKDVAIPMDERLYSLLQQFRRQIWEEVYAQIATELPKLPYAGRLYEGMDMQDVHTKNLFDAMLNPVFKMGCYASEQDTISQMSPTQKIMIPYAMKSLTNILWDEYERRIIRHIVEVSGTPTLSHEVIQDYWMAWARKERNGFEREIAHGVLTEHTTQGLKLKGKYAVAMLRMEGIIR